MCPGPHDISLDEAKILTQKYKLSVPAGSIRANRFGKTALEAILNPKEGDCVGLRIYYGIKDSGEPTLVIVGVDSNGGDLTKGKLAEYGIPGESTTPNTL